MVNNSQTIFLSNIRKGAPFAFTVFLSSLSILATAEDNSFILESMAVHDDQNYPELIIPPRLVNKIDTESLLAIEMPNLNGVLRNQSGLMLNQGSSQMPSSISIRGANGGLGLITLDGVPLFSNFAGHYSLIHYPLDVLAQVSITRGPGGERHGSRTLGGAIHLQSQHLLGKDSFLRLEGGSYDTFRTTVGSGFTSMAGDFSAVAGHTHVYNGINQAQTGSERDNFSMTHISANWAKEFEQGNLDASLYFVRTKEDIDGPGLVFPRATIGWADDTQGAFTNETWVAQIKGHYALAPHWNSSLQLGFTQDLQKTKTTLIPEFSVTNQLFMVDFKNSHRFTLGADNQNQTLMVWGVNTQHQQVVNSTVSNTIISPYIRGELLIDAWQWSGDVRFDFAKEHGNQQVFTLGVNRILPHHFRLLANIGTGYREPAMSELMNPFFGNKELKGEHNMGGEIGLHWHPQPESEIKVNGYYQHYRQLILLMFDSQAGQNQSGNVPKVDLWGAELQAQHRWATALKTGLNYTYTDATDALTNLRVPTLAEHQLVFWNEIQLLKPLSFRIELTAHTGYWYDIPNKLRAHTAKRVNALLKYQITPKANIYLRGENITDDQTPELYDFSYNGAGVYLGFRAGF